MSSSSRLYATAALMLMPFVVLVRPVTAQILDFGTGVGFPGDVVSVVAVLHSHRAGISALQGDIRFNRRAFSVKSCVLNPTISGKSISTSLVRPGLERFIVFGLNQGVLPNGVLFTCEFVVLSGASTSALRIATLSAADPQGNGVRLTSEPGRIFVLEASSESKASRFCNSLICRSPIASCEASHGCDGLSGEAAESCRQDCSRAVVAACHEDEDLPLCR
jgi:hypothetical protein